jgi:ubiquinol-cytochrome c reductase cytochrome b subunit
LVLLGLVVAHLIALHEVGSNNPDGIEVKDNLGPDGNGIDTIPSHPYYSTKDIFGVSVFLFIFSAVIFFAPEMGGYFLEYNNFIPADPLKTPPHIAPVWYFTPFYSMLRAITSEMMYVLVACVGLGALLGVLKTRLPAVAKLGVLGLAVAVPAVMGYNWLVRRNKTVMETVRTFGADIHGVLMGRKADITKAAAAR